MDDQISSASSASLSQYHSRLLSRHVDILALNRELVSGVEFFKSAINKSSNPEMRALNQSNFLDAIFEVFQLNEESSTLENLKKVNQNLTGEDPQLRSAQEAPLFGRFEVTPPSMIERALRRFFEWAGSDGYQDLHPIEQMAIGQIRLLEIRPFLRLSRLTGDIFSYSFLIKAGYLLPSYSEADRESLDNLIEEGLGFSTSGLVKYHLEACKRSYQKALKA